MLKTTHDLRIDAPVSAGERLRHHAAGRLRRSLVKSKTIQWLRNIVGADARHQGNDAEQFIAKFGSAGAQAKPSVAANGSLSYDVIAECCPDADGVRRLAQEFGAKR